MLLGSLALAGVVVSGASGHKGTSTTARIVALGSISALGVKAYQDSKDKAQQFQDAFTEKHMFKYFMIPPRKVIQRWILIENPNVENFTIKAVSKSGIEINVSVHLSTKVRSISSEG